jgi:DnaJ like chaperone protein
MTYWGKVVGTAVGLATGRPWIALLGLIIGHQFDRGFADKFTRLGPDVSDGRLEQLSPQFVEVLFQTMGHVAKADGRVSEDEIRAARTLMHRLGLGPLEIRKAIGWFEVGKNPGFPLHGKLRDLRARGARKPEARALFVRLLMEIALANGSVHQRERTVLWKVCTELDIGRVELAQLEAMLRAQRGFRRSVAGDADARRLADAYQTLGIDKSATNEEIKKAYRRLMNRTHPDKLAGANPDKSAITEAERRTREVRGAYDLLKARRTIR